MAVATACQITAATAAESVRNEFDHAADVVGCLGVGEGWVIGLHMGQDENDDLVIAPAAGEVAAFASDLSEHHYSS